MTRTSRSLLLGLAALLIASPASAHVVSGTAAGFVSGFLHPLGGVDHMLAMIAVGIWGTQMGAPAVWLLPVAFPVVMAFGGVLGIRGVFLPASEPAIALSAFVLGAMILTARRPPLAAAAAIVATFAIFHGYAHGVEIPAALNPLAYGVGFVLVTGLLHATGIAIGLLQHLPRGSRVLRGAGMLIAAAGIYLLVEVL